MIRWRPSVNYWFNLAKRCPDGIEYWQFLLLVLISVILIAAVGISGVIYFFPHKEARAIKARVDPVVYDLNKDGVIDNSEMEKALEENESNKAWLLERKKRSENR
jgi:hypothetical protein